MNVIQGRYLQRIESGKGKLKAIVLKTPQGEQTVQLPKSLRAIAQAELTLGEPVRVWADSSENSPKKGANKKQSARLWATQLIPLSPKARVSAPLDTETLSKGTQSKKSKSKKSKSKKSKTQLTVQLCQKKNCCKRGGDDLWTAFEAASRSEKNFQIEAVGCLGGCKNGPNIRLLPENVKYRHVQPAEIDTLLQRHGTASASTH
ncbi:MAG: (2Fe-2S) ferredoxin domain-containing protein [Phormidesmis sp.]